MKFNKSNIGCVRKFELGSWVLIFSLNSMCLCVCAAYCAANKVNVCIKSFSIQFSHRSQELFSACHLFVRLSRTSRTRVKKYYLKAKIEHTTLHKRWRWWWWWRWRLRRPHRTYNCAKYLHYAFMYVDIPSNTSKQTHAEHKKSIFMLNGFHFSYDIIIFCHPSKLAFVSRLMELFYHHHRRCRRQIEYYVFCILLHRCCVFVDVSVFKRHRKAQLIVSAHKSTFE